MTYLWILLGLLLILAYGQALYVVLQLGFDERNIDVIRWHIKDEPAGMTFFLAVLLVAAIPVMVVTVFTGPLWLIGKVLGKVIGA